MKELTSEGWQKNPTPRMMWVWDHCEIEKMADCSNCKHWHYSTRLLVYFCDCSDKISDSINSRTYEHCDKWELAE